ncbi:MAG: NlpC/P60 family protein [Acidobacteriota bacterium]
MIDIAAGRTAVVAEASAFLGTPFHHQGRLQGVGVDCAYLLAEVYERVCGMQRMDFGYYPIDWFRHARDERYRDQVALRCLEVATPGPGDIALFRMGHAYSHGAIVVEWPRVIHAHWRNGVEIADATQNPLGGRACVFYSPWGDR